MASYPWQRLFIAAAFVGIAVSGFRINASGQELSASPELNRAITDDESLQDESAQPSALQDSVETLVAAQDTACSNRQPGPSQSSGQGCTCTVCTKKKVDAANTKAKDAFKGVFYANDYSYLKDPCYTGHLLGDNLKQLTVPGDGKLDLGGEIRVRYHNEDNMRGPGLTGRDDQFWLTRLRLFANYRVNDWLRTYGEFLYADSGGELFPSRSIEENRGEAQNLFVEAKLFDEGSAKLSARVGRQELLYGSQRLISPLDWANTRRTFDGYKLTYSSEDWDADGFFVNPVARLLIHEDKWDPADTNIDFYGLYTTRKGLPIGSIDFYWLGIDYQIPGATHQTVGTRVSGIRGTVLYEVENGLQFGENSNGSDHFAGYFTAGLGRKLDLSAGATSWKPTVWAWYDYASGEDDFNQVGVFDNGFDQLFPLVHKYLGFIDLFGRRNINDFNAQLITPVFGDRVNLLLWYHYFMLVDLTTPYGVNQVPFNTTTPAASRDLGQEIDVLFTATLNPRNSVQLGYSFFDSGAYYSRTANVPFAGDVQFLYAQYQMQF